jgi:hypothetical protein
LIRSQSRGWVRREKNYPGDFSLGLAFAEKLFAAGAGTRVRLKYFDKLIVLENDISACGGDNRSEG